MPQPGGDTERTMVFADKMSRLECSSKAIELQERIAEQNIKTAYSRFVCVPVPSERGE